MTPQEKAAELVNKYVQVYDGRLPIAKKCASIAVDDEIINQLTSIEKAFNNLSAFNYWKEVKQEIEEL